MVVYLIIGFIATLLCSFMPNKKQGLGWAFFVITIFLSIRYMWGSDYIAYLSIYNETNGFNTGGLFDLGNSEFILEVNKEYGWAIINRLAGVLHMGFFGMVAALSVFECWIVHRTILKYVKPNYYWVAVLTWFFSVYSFCVNASMMRQYLCICLYLIVIDLMIEKRVRYYLIWSIGIILLSSTIHRSSIFLLASLPLFYLKFEEGRKSNILVVIIGVVFILWTVYGRKLVEPYMISFLEDSEDFSQYMRYINTDDSGNGSMGLGVILRYIVFIFWLYILPKLEKQQQPIVLLLILSYFFEVLASVAPMISRLSFYFSFLEMVCWAWLFEKAKTNKILYVIFGLELIMIVWTVPKFFFSSLWSNSFLHFHTIFQAGDWM